MPTSMEYGYSTPAANSPVLTFGINKDRRDIDVASDIARLIPDANPFLVILMRARKKATNTAEFHWWDSEPGAWWTQINNQAGYADSDQTLAVDDASLFRPKDIIKVPRTGEVMFVTESNETADTIKVVRGYSNTTPASLDDNDWLLRLGNAMEEFSKAPQAKIAQPVKEYNYTQIFRRPFDQSMTSEREALKTNETERNRLRRDQALEHRLDIERALLFGERYEDTSNKRRTTGGLLSFIKTKWYDAGNNLTEDKFEEFCEGLFQHGKGRKLFICSYRVGSIINKFAKDRIETRSGESTYGVRLTQYKSFHGDLFIVPSRTLEREYMGLGIGIDMDYVAYRPLRGRDTTLKTNIQDNDADGWRDEYLTEVGLEVRLEKVHAVLENAVPISGGNGEGEGEGEEENGGEV